MIFSLDLWHKNWGFGFTLALWEQIDDTNFVKFEFFYEVKLFGKRWHKE